VIAVLFGLVKRVEKMGPQDLVTSHDWVPWAIVAGFGAFLGGVWFLGLKSLQSRLRVESVSAGGAAVQLSAKENSYFDEYLDEIVYFFQRTKTQVAIFEDLDRFKDPHIFETLRELNTLLNNCEQIKARPVRFVYAVRDSIFEQLEQGDTDEDPDAVETVLPASKLESAPAANRTKFFDLVVPMVPFLTHRSARDLVAEEFAGSKDQPDSALVNLVSAKLTDMRLIRNIRNEFEIYRASILGDNGLKGLTSDRLFAMMVYKNLHLEDFEAIRHGASTIDGAHRAFRDMVKYQTGHQAAISKNALDQAASSRLWDKHARAAGERLQTGLALLHRASRRPGQPVLHFQGQNHDLPALTAGSFWKALFDTREQTQLLAPGYGTTTTSLSFDELIALAGESAAALDASVEADVARSERTSRIALETKDYVSKATMAELMARADLKMPTDDGEHNLDNIVTELVSPLARDLIAKGFIDENFTLYCSDYHAIAISVSAMNFILHCVQPDVADHRFRFDEPASIDAVEKETDSRFLDGESVFNIEVFDHYLTTNPKKLEKALESLVFRVGDDPTFVDAYLLDGAASKVLITQLAARWPMIFVHLIESSPVPQADLTALVDAAIQGAGKTVDYETSDQVADFVSNNYDKMEALVGDADTDKAAEIAMVLGRLDVEISVLGVLGETQRAAVVTAGLYPVTRPNLISALGGTTLTLDILKASHADVYEHVLANLYDYLDALADDEATVNAPDQFLAVLADVLAADESLVEAVADRASEDCEVSDLDDLDETAWSAVVAAGRFAPTVSNIGEFVSKYGVTDELAEDLTSRDLTDPGDLELEPRLRLAYAFAESEHLTEEDTLHLIGQLDLPGGLTADRLADTGRTMVPALLEAGLLPDTAETYACISGRDYAFRENYFAVSKDLATYVTDLPLTQDDLPKMMKSRRVATAVKRAIADDVDFVRERLTRAGAIAICEWADKGQAISAELLMELGKADAPAERVLSLLEPHLSDIDQGDLDQILVALGEDYEPLTYAGHHRPKLKSRPGTEQLLDELKKRGRVSSYGPGLLGGIKVNMRH
jgi:hypothetical protein